MTSNPEALFRCTACRRKYRWSAELASRKLRCKCGETFVVPERPEPAKAPRAARESTKPGVAAGPPPAPPIVKRSAPQAAGEDSLDIDALLRIASRAGALPKGDFEASWAPVGEPTDESFSERGPRPAQKSTADSSSTAAFSAAGSEPAEEPGSDEDAGEALDVVALIRAVDRSMAPGKDQLEASWASIPDGPEPGDSMDLPKSAEAGEAVGEEAKGGWVGQVLAKQAATPAQPTQRACPNCLALVGGMLCTKCGYNLDTGEQKQTAVLKPVKAPAKGKDKKTGEEDAKERGQKRKTALWVIALGVLGLVLPFVGVQLRVLSFLPVTVVPLVAAGIIGAGVYLYVRAR